ncbi:phosphoesterase PA-phosphatase related [Gloeothece citriformis PCC 7424]|uniref:Phosphoesterase PA-phosphatase related n=1 Tax=Gloeothece citriformis (strain PCC 7424) TaxID=65393 RepID=B7KG36_GLOC7|nr:phosphatase PAP2 family protein [Gloeothece citriformis]ACK69229.1 phosphoesterase PA-phosphatase related [Gloeothece citriformis PCC 7424]
MSNYSIQSPIIQAIHTAVQGRARYKVNRLYHSESLKRYLESELSEYKGINQVRANVWTGNILVIFDKEISLDSLSKILQNVVLDYRQHRDELLRKNLSATSVRQEELVLSGVNQSVASTPQSLSELDNKKDIEGIDEPDFLNRNGYHKNGSLVMINTLLNKSLNQANKHLIWIGGTVGTLAIATGLLHYFKLDTAILLFLQKLHTPILDRIMLGITFLGEPGTLLLVCLGLIISPLTPKRKETTTTLSLATLGAVSLNYWLKIRFGRLRPALWRQIIRVRHYSFPSGHAMMSSVTYGFIAYLLSKQFPQRRTEILAVSSILIVAIGLSRLYLGVHWPTDVLAGYAVGLVWLSACIFFVEL